MEKLILVVDDDDMLRKTLAQGLRKEGYVVITAESAEFAQQILERVYVDAIILDRMMAGMDGLTFLKQLRSNNNFTPTIMLTAMSGGENTIEGLYVGADDYISKPFHLKELVLRLNNVLKNKPITYKPTLPEGLFLINEDFFVQPNSSTPKKLLSLSNEEKKLLQELLTPIGNTVTATPMVAKRLRNKINELLSNIDIVTVRGEGYKIITKR
ncbi:MAG: response regulator transcription factor [Alphaproteobacteria bacterium]|nr:response regulator transcription factor [Alphaproteobacteria bacterium]